MNDFTGKICPYCKTSFQPDDDVVVCSDCEMPHHKDCWIENQGCTTFGCSGTIAAADSAASSVTATQMQYDEPANTATNDVIFCTQCGAQNRRSSSFCAQCGTKLAVVTERIPHSPVYAQADPANTNPYAYVSQPQAPAYQPKPTAYQPKPTAYQPQPTAYQPQPTAYQQPAYQPQANPYQANGYTAYQAYQPPGIDYELQQMIGPKAEYYVPKFQEMKVQNKQTSWNWAAFLVTPYWMIYRKMYGYGAAVLGAGFLISLIDSGLLAILSLVGYIVLGVYANSIYMKHLEAKVQEAKAMTEPYKSQFIASNGGVNTLATVLTVIGYALLVAIING